MKTAKKLVQDKNIDAKTRFAIACTYFLEGEVLSLWYGNNKVKVWSIPRNGTNAAVRFWMKHLSSPPKEFCGFRVFFPNDDDMMKSIRTLSDLHIFWNFSRKAGGTALELRPCDE
ncbi:hypothetical protein AVEN_16338-1 [Araneus ventricosus]|uniref:Uncharacterized protein n=1 Tax=Araneus ventricosus TaxID=182803 RepID=A0A4Y2JC55_ARAVE|nr:hypothetical protein AVEN_16338-1 [Araneus ventricosus]